MSFTYLRALPTPEEIKQQYPLSAKLAAIKADRDNQIKDIISGKDDRLLLLPVRVIKGLHPSRTRKKHRI